MVKLQIETLGERHPDTLCSMMGLVNSFEALGRSQKALVLKNMLIGCLKQDATLNTKTAFTHALQSLTWDRDQRSPNETTSKLAVKAGALQFLIDLCRTDETVGIGLLGLDNLTCLHNVRVQLITEGVFEKMMSLLLDLDEVARSNVEVNSLLGTLDRMCLEPECVRTIMGGAPRNALSDLSHSEDTETKRLAKHILHVSLDRTREIVGPKKNFINMYCFKCFRRAC